jgi:hypothetical protein
MKKISQVTEFPFSAFFKKEEPVVINEVQDVEEEAVDEVSEDVPAEDEVVVTIPESEELIDDDGEVVEETSVEDGVKEYVFTLKDVPGAAEDVVEEPEEEEEEKKEVVEEQPVDDWNWEKGGTSKFLDWLQNRFKSVPQHSGSDTTGIERAISYFERLNVEISKAMKKDYKREIDAAKAEEARAEIMKGMERLLERLEKLNSKKFKRTKKRAELQNSLVKNAGAALGNIVVSVPYLISNIARTCINASVKNGQDIEQIFSVLAKDFDLDKREKYQVVLLIKDMGYPMIIDRVNFGKDITSDSIPSEFITNYPN